MATTLASLHAYALTLPDTTADVACKGTAIESRTAKVHGKAFLFTGAGALRLKLGDAVAEAMECAAREPERFEVGKGGWIKVTVRDGGLPPAPLLKRWIRESHGLFAAARAPKKPPTRTQKAPPKGR